MKIVLFKKNTKKNTQKTSFYFTNQKKHVFYNTISK